MFGQLLQVGDVAAVTEVSFAAASAVVKDVSMEVRMGKMLTHAPGHNSRFTLKLGSKCERS